MECSSSALWNLSRVSARILVHSLCAVVRDLSEIKEWSQVWWWLMVVNNEKTRQQACCSYQTTGPLCARQSVHEHCTRVVTSCYIIPVMPGTAARKPGEKCCDTGSFWCSTAHSIHSRTCQKIRRINDKILHDEALISKLVSYNSSSNTIESNSYSVPDKTCQIVSC